MRHARDPPANLLITGPSGIGKTTVLGTIARSGGALIAEVRQRPDVTLVDVTLENRDGLPAKIAGMLGL